MRWTMNSQNTGEQRVIFQDTDRLNSPLEVFIHGDNASASGAVGPHWHYYLEMLYILTGQIEAHCDGVTYLLSPGDLILFYPQSVHSMQLYQPEEKETKNKIQEARYFVLMMDLNFLNITSAYRTRFSKIFRIAFEKNPSNIHFSREMLQDIPIRRLILDSYEEMRKKEHGYDVMICSHFAEILTYLVRCLRSKGLDTDEIITAPDEIDASIYSISKYIHQHCSESLRVQDLAARCGMSYSYFAKLFRKTYNQSCKEYIEFAQLNKVTDLLLFTNRDLAYISQETGFADCSHLIRTFKKWKGMTPKQWRKMMKGDA